MPTDLVTGASGFIGSHLVDSLISSGRDVRVLLRPTSSLRWLPERAIETMRLAHWDTDQLISVVSGIDTLYHVAGVTHARSPEAFRTFHTESTRNLLDACLKTPISPRRIVIFSSLAAAGPSFTGVLVHEDDEPQPVSWYGESKLAQERLAQKYADSLSVVIIRPPAVYGPRDSDLFRVFRMIQGGLFAAPFHGEGMQSFTYVSDIVDGARAAAEQTDISGEKFFIASHEIVTWNVLADTVASQLGVTPRRIHIPRRLLPLAGALAEFFSRLTGRSYPLDRNKAREGTFRHWICSPQKAQRKLGFQARVSLTHGIRKTLEWYREEGWM